MSPVLLSSASVTRNSRSFHNTTLLRLLLIITSTTRSLSLSPSLPLPLSLSHTHHTNQLVEGDLRPSTVQHEPPGCCSNSGHTHIYPNDEVAEEEPTGDQWVLDGAGRLVHDVYLWRVEAQGCGWETVSDKVDPEQLDWDECLRQSQGSCNPGIGVLITFQLNKTSSL